MHIFELWYCRSAIDDENQYQWPIDAMSGTSVIKIKIMEIAEDLVGEGSGKIGLQSCTVLRSYLWASLHIRPLIELHTMENQDNLERKRKCAAAMAAAYAAYAACIAVVHHHQNYLNKLPSTNGETTRNDIMGWLVDERETDCRNQLQMGKDAFAKLVYLLRGTNRLHDNVRNSVEEQLAKFYATDQAIGVGAFTPKETTRSFREEEARNLDNMDEFVSFDKEVEGETSDDLADTCMQSVPASRTTSSLGLKRNNKRTRSLDVIAEKIEELGNKIEKLSKSFDKTENVTRAKQMKKPNPRELNPYPEDNGSGYPEDVDQAKSDGNQLSSSVVGDGGASWRLKSLKRAQEQAAREGRKLDQVVEEQSGSLGQLAVSVASRAAAPSRAHLHAINDRKKEVSKKCETAAENRIMRDTKKVYGGSREYLPNVSLRRPEMREPKIQDSLSWRKRKGQSMSAEDAGILSAAVSNLNKFANDGSFMLEVKRPQNKDADGSLGSSCTNYEGNEYMESEMVSSESNNPSANSSIPKQVLSANQLAAKALQFRMEGKHEEAEKLLKEAENIKVEQDTEDKLVRHGTEGSASRYCLLDQEYNEYEDGPSRKQNQKRRGVHEHTLNEKNRLFTQQERCQFCFENPARPRHLVVSIANFTYLMFPQWQPVVPGHCCILPMQHEASTRTVDNNAWDEIRNFKKCLLMMFAKQEKDVVFLETVMGLARQSSHCLVECIPLPREIAKQAPLYFKKAIDEAEDEWSQHNAKKLIDTSVKGLRGSIPKDFPYFHVEFGLNNGFVHVIDDEKQFKSSFGLNVIRGMLCLPEEDMYRRQKQESVETQKQLVLNFARDWAPFDWTQQLG
ncbi:hypothetical protein HHK36_025834 [Tetracentron sinense]|uniref:CWF19-like protein 2 n=1 Tax=Tetracentron sinense TaxID=13715 RepID=A0A834YL85_TETSI|nr:hypothetical protein HHK36_025834 [Tetracentron sinense]